MKNLTTPHVVVIVAFLSCVTVLGVTNKDQAALIAVGVAILAGLGLQLGQTIAVKENTNGNNARLLELLESNQRELASVTRLMATMTPPPPLAVVPTIEPAAPTWTPDQGKLAA